MKAFIKKQFACYKLFSANFFKNFQGPFYGFVLPPFLAIILLFAGLGGSSIQGKQSIVTTLILLPAITNGFVTLSVAIAEWKESILLKRIEATPITKKDFTISLLIFYSFISMLGSIWMLLITIILCASKAQGLNINTLFNHFNIGWFILAIITTSFISISSGVLIGGLVGSNSMAQAISLSIYFPIVFLGGINVPLFVIYKSDALKYINYILPVSYGSYLNVLAWGGNHLPPSISKSFNNLYPGNWLPALMPFIFGAGILTTSILTFKFEVKN